MSAKTAVNPGRTSITLVSALGVPPSPLAADDRALGAAAAALQGDVGLDIEVPVVAARARAGQRVGADRDDDRVVGPVGARRPCSLGRWHSSGSGPAPREWSSVPPVFHSSTVVLTVMVAA